MTGSHHPYPRRRVLILSVFSLLISLTILNQHRHQNHNGGVVEARAISINHKKNDPAATNIVVQKRYRSGHSPYSNPSHPPSNALHNVEDDDHDDGVNNGGGSFGRGGETKRKRRISASTSLFQSFFTTGQTPNTTPEESSSSSSTLARSSRSGRSNFNRLTYNPDEDEDEEEEEDDGIGIPYYYGYDEDEDDYEIDAEDAIDEPYNFKNNNNNYPHPKHGMAVIEPISRPFSSSQGNDHNIFSLDSKTITYSNKDHDNVIARTKSINSKEMETPDPFNDSDNKEDEQELQQAVEDEEEALLFYEEGMNGIPDEDGRYPDFDNGFDPEDESSNNLEDTNDLFDFWFDNDDDRPLSLYKSRRNTPSQQDNVRSPSSPFSSSSSSSSFSSSLWPWVLDEWDDSLEGADMMVDNFDEEEYLGDRNAMDELS